MSEPDKSGNEPGKSLFVFVGDVSADYHTAKLLARLREVAPDLRVWGVGGQAMEAEGAELLHDCRSFACVGIIEVIRFLPFLSRLKSELIQEVERRRPDAVLLVDFAGFNLKLASALRSKYPDLPILYFISPQVWGSRPWRMNTIARTISKMLVIFPFEEPLYLGRGIPARFVGHPLTQTVTGDAGQLSREEFCKAHCLDPNRFIVGIFPGSRRQEIKDHLPVLMEAVAWLNAQRPDLQFVMSQANSILAENIDSLLNRTGYRRLVGTGLTLLPPGASLSLMSVSDLVWAKSGTTTLEAALLGKPMLIFYRGNWLSYLIFLLFKRVRHVGWPNILAGQGVVPELIQLDCRAEQFVRYTLDWLDVPAARQAIGEQLRSLKARLGEGTFAETAASEVLSWLGLSDAASEESGTTVIELPTESSDKQPQQTAPQGLEKR